MTDIPPDLIIEQTGSDEPALCYEIYKIETTKEWGLFKIHKGSLVVCVATFWNQERALEFAEYMKRDRHEVTAATI